MQGVTFSVASLSRLNNADVSTKLRPNCDTSGQATSIANSCRPHERQGDRRGSLRLASGRLGDLEHEEDHHRDGESCQCENLDEVVDLIHNVGAMEKLSPTG